MLLKIRDTLLSNVSQQVAGIAIFLTIPRILSVEDYATTVFVSVLLSFVSLADFGFTFVYSRKLPALHHLSDENELARWHSTAFWFPFIAAFVMGFILALIYYIKFHIFLHSVFIFFIPACMALTTFFSAKYTAQGDFSVYRNLNITQSILKTFTIPFVFFSGLWGWFIGQIIISAAGCSRLWKENLPTVKSFDMQLIINHFYEGLSLIVVFSLWTQLMGLGRLLSASHYTKAMIADYGIMSAAYQILTTLIIAAFVPFSVYILKMMSVDEKKTVATIFKVIFITFPALFFLIIISQTVAPYLFKYFFAKYQYDAVIFELFLYGLITLPIILTLGNVFIAKQKVFYYIGLLGVSFLIGLVTFYYMLPIYGNHAAALAQLIGLSACALLMLTVSLILFYEIIDKKIQKLLSVLLIWILFAIFEFKVMH